MPDTFRLDIVTPEKLVVSEDVEEMSAPGTLGRFGVLPGHAPFLTTLGIGPLEYRSPSKTDVLSIAWGFADVRPDRVVVLVETAEHAAEIDLARAVQAVHRAQERLANAGDDLDAAAAARDSLEKALLRKELAEKYALRGET